MPVASSAGACRVGAAGGAVRTFKPATVVPVVKAAVPVMVML